MRKLSALVVLLCAQFALAQSDRGTITGTVSDATGAVVAGAPVEIRNIETSAIYKAASSATGNYTLAELPTGMYELSVTVSGFKKFVQANINLPVAQTVRIDAVLQVGANTDSVTVIAETALLKTESGELSHNVSTENLDELPVLSIGGTSATGLRNPYATMQLIPGTYYAQDSAMRVNGMPSNTESLKIEGQESSTGLWFTQSWTQPSVDAIQEVGIQTSNFAAEFGEVGGGVFNTTMKSGTNQFHGSAYEYFDNEALNASQPFLNVKNRVRQNDYGFTVGGPVWIPKVYNGKDKTFFFFSFEQFRNNPITSTTTTTMPTAAFRSGNFSSLPQFPTGTVDPITGSMVMANTIYNPASDYTTPGGQTERLPFPNNTIPQSMMDPLALKIQSLLPAPNISGTSVNNYLDPAYRNPKRSTIPSLKVDQNLSDTAKLSVFWQQTALYTPNADGLPQPITTSVATNSRNNTSRVNYDQTITPTLLYHVGIGLLNLNYQQLAQPFNVHTGLATAGAPNGLTGVYDPNLFPTIQGINSVYGGGPLELGGYTHAQITNIKPTANTSLTWVHGNHTFKFGGEFIADGYINHNQTYAAPWITFSANDTSDPALAGLGFASGSPGFGYASFLLGRVDNGYTAEITDTRLGKHSIAGFAQDSWKMTRKMTLDYGLRYDFQTYLKEEHGVQSDLSPSTPNPGTGNLPGGTIFEATCKCNFAHNYPWAFGPRLGFAYQFAPKWVFRAGTGVSYSRTAANNFQSYAVGGNTPYAAASYGYPAYQLASGLPFVLTYPNFNAGQFPVNGVPAGSLSFFDQNAGRPARTLSWSAGFQRELPGNIVADVTYVGNRGVWWQANSIVNDDAINPTVLATQHNGLSATTIDPVTGKTLMLETLASVLKEPAVAAQYNITLPYALFPTTNTVAQSVRPYPEYTSILRLWNPDGDTWYNALQTKLTKRFSHGFQFSSAFTWSKNEDIGAEGDVSFFQSVTTDANDVFNRKNNKYLSGYDQPFAFLFNGTYTTPRIPQNKWLSLMARDWQIGAVLNYTSGLPILAPLATNGLSSTYFQTTYDSPTGQPFYLKNPNCGCFDPNNAFILNPAAWSNPAPGTFGTSAAYYSNYRRQRAPVENMNLARNFRIKEKYNLQIRMEFTNIFNRVILNAPTSTNAFAAQIPNAAGLHNGSGFGYISTLTTAQPPRAGQLVARFTF